MTNIKGTVVKILPQETGNGKKGQWIKQSFVIETEGQYPKKIHFTAYGEKAEAVAHLNTGEQIDVHFNPESREYNERWYTELRAWKWEVSKSEPKKSEEVGKSGWPIYNTSEEDDLPF